MYLTEDAIMNKTWNEFFWERRDNATDFLPMMSTIVWPIGIVISWLNFEQNFYAHECYTYRHWKHKCPVCFLIWSKRMPKWVCAVIIINVQLIVVLNNKNLLQEVNCCSGVGWCWNLKKPPLWKLKFSPETLHMVCVSYCEIDLACHDSNITIVQFHNEWCRWASSHISTILPS